MQLGNCPRNWPVVEAGVEHILGHLPRQVEVILHAGRVGEVLATLSLSA